MLLEHIHKKFEIDRTKIKGDCQLGKKVVTYNSKSDLPLVKNVKENVDFFNFFCIFDRVCAAAPAAIKPVFLPRTRWKLIYSHFTRIMRSHQSLMHKTHAYD